MNALKKQKVFFTRFFVNLFKPLVNNYVNRNIILLIDLIITLVAAKSASFLVATITDTPFNFLKFRWEIFIIILVQGICFLLFRSYSGLIRYSNFRDVIKQLQVTTTAVISLIIINSLYALKYGTVITPYAGIIIYGFIAFSFLFIFRVFVKRAYKIIQINKVKAKKAFILGIKPNDISMAEGFISESSEQVEIAGFINTEGKLLRKLIFNLPIYSLEQLKNSTNTPKNIIVGDEKLKELQNSNSNIIPTLLDLKFKIYKLPELQNLAENNKQPSGALKEIKIEDLLQRSPIKLNNEKLFDLYKNKTILVTGAAGSIGSEIVKQVIRFKPKKILLLDQAETPLHELCICLNKFYPEIGYEKIVANVRDKKRLKDVFTTHQPQVVFHGAAYKHVPMMEENPIEALSVNFQGSRNLADLATKYKVENFVFISTDKAVNPTNIMGASKRSAELYIQSLAHKNNHNTTFITTRFGNVLGSNGSVIPHFKKQIRQNGPVTVTHPEITRYFMTIDEACQLVLEAGAMGKGGEIFVFDMGSPVKILDLAKHMIRLTGLIPGKDIAIEITGLRPGEKLYEELLADKETTLPTHHEKIMIAQATHEFNEAKINLLSNLLELVKTNNADKAIEALHLLVPEYQPASLEEQLKA
ncbi:MAG: UDP-N-acetylglucosamine 4,6-dehydratase family protein [Mesonia hippocampi]|uniref:UDP-N-acetylglucosamine 4,6-dehydratase family protein n=1 Tax=Mesonia hippocampi TaxID=1628250 RepID=UPI003F94FC22